MSSINTYPPFPMPTINYKAALQLDWIVVGGGISGLATAFVLQKAGHRVRVLDRLKKLGTPASGLRVPPNLSKIFKQWFGEEALSKVAVRNVGTPWIDINTGERIGYHPWKPVVMKETGGDFLMMHHEDVQKMLYKLATDVGVKVEFGVDVASVEAGDPKPRVILANGEVLTADMVVGADGATSIVRQTAFGIEDDAVQGGVTLLGGIAPAEEMLKDPVLGKMVLADEWPIFMGTIGACHPVRAKKEFAIQLFVPTSEGGPQNDGKESFYEVIPTSAIDISSYADDVQRLLKMVPYFTRSRYMKRSKEVTDWMDKSCRIVLIGEAAHPWFPGGSHTTSMVVEDAVVLGTLFSHLDSWSQVKPFLYAYQEIREGRTKAVKQEELTNTILVHLPPGPERDARNLHMATPATEADWDDSMLQRELANFAGIFCYDASDAAEEWWVDWGRYSHRPSEERERETRLSFLYSSAVVSSESVTAPLTGEGKKQ
ncbi:FAD/NAD(P)-binding domain-containing protein [Cristinia sonorae]|uniref:FAD/NAD(P)-binding domain-containing protein n=1 Tax=Cristinia sonorae TaxID=1940300 RepID=A0A8K0XN86_9AGAR|nr:FAD/NAD(P)-binding domain-containing protein [Cristinia sonorae]